MIQLSRKFYIIFPLNFLCAWKKLRLEKCVEMKPGQFRWPCGLRRRSAVLWFGEIAGSNPAEGMDVRLCLLRVVQLATSATS